MHEIILILTGVVVGAMNAIAGGGMLIGFPILVALGLPPIVANATANIVSAPGQFTSALGYREFLRKVPRRYLLLLIPIVIGALFGSLALRYTPAEHFAHMIPVLVLFGVALFVFQPLMHFHLHSHLKGRSRRMLPIVLLGLAMLPLSFYGGYFGAGYGFMMLAFLGMTNLHDTHMINAMKNVAAIGVSTTAVIVLYGAHLIDWRTGAFMALGCMAGGYGGSRMAQRVSSHKLRIVIIIIGLVSVAYLGLTEY